MAYMNRVGLWMLAPVLGAGVVPGLAEATRTGSFSSLETSFVSESSGEAMNRGVCVGDVNGNGKPDFLIGAPGNDLSGTDSGRAYLFLDAGVSGVSANSVANASLVFVGDAGSKLGARAFGGQDLSGDGIADLLIAAPGWGSGKGRVYLFYGRTDWSGVTLSSADLVIEGTQVDQFLGGGGVLIPGDVNGDGYLDLVITSPGFDIDSSMRDRGALYLFFGNSFGWSTRTLITADATYRGDGNSDLLGSAIAPLGDVNADGLADFVVSAPYRDESATDSGMVYLMLGGEFVTGEAYIGLEAFAKFRGDAAGDLLGASLAGAGDVDGDGLNDILIGAPYSDYNGSDSGRVYFIKGRRAGWPITSVYAKDEAAFTFFGSTPGESIGKEGSLAMAELSGDDMAELVFLADTADAAGTDSGRAYIFLGRSSGWGTAMNVAVAEVVLEGEAAGDRVGIIDPLGIGDLNTDGRDEIFIGAPGSDAGGADSGKVYEASLISRWFDLDGDTYAPIEGDCDDSDADVNPSIETDDRDGVDNDCDGEVDEDSSGGCKMAAPGTTSPLQSGAFLSFGIAAIALGLRRRARRS